MPRMSPRREAFLLALIALVALGSLALFSAQDRRDPNDHDSYSADEILPALTDYADPEHSGGRSAVLAREFLERGSYPPLARASRQRASERGLGLLRVAGGAAVFTDYVHLDAAGNEAVTSAVGALLQGG